MLAWFGGVAVDLREAQLAPGRAAVAHSLFGGIAIRVPVGWRVESSARALSGGVAVDVPEPDDPDAPTLTSRASPPSVGSRSARGSPTRPSTS